MTTLAGKVAVITGASRGLGLAIAQTYAQAGAAVVLAARSVDAVQREADALNAAGFRAAAFGCDVGDKAQVDALAAFAVATFGQFDIWVNNAGVAGVYGPTVDVPVPRFEAVIQTNILGAYYGSHAAIEHFLPRKTGKLINLLGRGDDGPVKYQNAYGPSKIWIRSFTLGLAQEYKDSGIGVYAFNPGLVDTDLLRQVDAVAGYEDKLKFFGTIIRLWANPPAVPAEKALWLASSATDGKTGLVVSVLSKQRLAAGIVRELGRRLRRQPIPETALQITSVPRDET